MIQTLVSALANKHTTGAGLAYALAKFGSPIFNAWFPGHEAAVKTTSESLEGLAVFYGLAAAGDAGKSATKDDLKAVTDATATAIKTGDTTTLTKPTQ